MTAPQEQTTAVEVTATTFASLPLPHSWLGIGTSAFDVLFRVTSDATLGNVNVAWQPTAQVNAAIAAWITHTKRDVVTLVEVVNWQHALLDYNAQYNAFLLNQVTEDEFENLSKQIAYEPTDQLPTELAHKIQTVIALTDLDLTSSDFASLFRCTKESVDKALELLNR